MHPRLLIAGLVPLLLSCASLHYATFISGGPWPRTTKICIAQDLFETKTPEVLEKHGGTYEQAIRSYLKKAGFVVGPAGLFEDRLRERFVQESLDLSRIKRVVKWKSDEVFNQVLDELRKKEGVHAVLFFDLLTVSAPIHAGVAVWHGRAAPAQLLSAGLTHGLRAAPALSLRVRVVSVARETLYDNAGGVAIFAGMVGGSFANWVIQNDEVFSDEQDNAEAVDIALSEFVSRARK